MNPTKTITPQEAVKRGASQTLEELIALAETDPGECENCGQPAWRFGQVGMCFTCTTGESDPSNDFELVPETAGSKL